MISHKHGKRHYLSPGIFIPPATDDSLFTEDHPFSTSQGAHFFTLIRMLCEDMCKCLRAFYFPYHLSGEALLVLAKY